MNARFSILISVVAGALLQAFLVSCGSGNSNSNNPQTGKSPKDSVKTALACVDETYQPILSQEVELFHHHNPDKAVKVTYKPEREAIKALMEGEVSVAVVSRPATKGEKEKLRIIGNVRIHETLVGYDALAIIANKENPVQKLSIENLILMLQGKITNWKQLGGEDKDIVIVFDNPASGTVRYMVDSLLRGGELPKNVYASKTNPQVIRYVGETPQAIGFIGLAWVSDKDSPEVQAYLEKVNKMALKAEGAPDVPEQYFQPFQSEIKLGKYPLSRQIYCLNRESSHKTGTDFVYFFASDVGQRILLKAGLLPEFMPPRPIVFVQE